MTDNKPQSIKDQLLNQPIHNGDPDCKKCYGKGYSSELTGISWGSDLGSGDPGRKDVLNTKPCACTKKTEPIDPEGWMREVKEQPTQSTWEEEFLKEFPMLFSHANEKGRACWFSVKEFISKVEKQAYERGVKECIEELKAFREALSKKKFIKVQLHDDLTILNCIILLKSLNHV